MTNYNDFLKSKVRIAQSTGFECDINELNPNLKPHNKLMVKWMVEGGRRACFASFGLHKTVTQLEAVRIINHKSNDQNGTNKPALIICPLGVRQEFKRDAIKILKWEYEPKFIRNISEVTDAGVYLTNYETVRDGKLDPRLFNVASLDEASILRGLGGTKTFREFMKIFTGDAGPLGDRRGNNIVPFRFVATATPSPNEYIELLAYADFLGIMDVSQAKTRFFKRDSTQADKLTIHAHKEEEFWLWVSSWALFITKPSDITGDALDDIGYEMPAMDVRWHELPSDHSNARIEKSGQYRMFKDTALGLSEAAQEKRESLDIRIKKMLEIRAENPNAHRIIWHDLEPERHAIEKALPNAVSIYGKLDLDKREDAILDFSDGKFQELAAKPIIAGSGCNFQRHCNWAIYLGIGFKFNDFIQSIHRIQRFLQKNQVRIDLIYTEAERNVRKTLETKWKNHNKMVFKMIEIIKKYGLSQVEMAQHLTRKIGVERFEVEGKNFQFINNDNVPESKNLKTDSVGLILTSWPFSNQYEYSPNYADFGHCESNNEFFAQMDFLTPELYRSLMPGRLYALHVKDRIIPMGLTGMGVQETYPFHIDCILHMKKHGFAYLGMKTIVTDVVRENNQTYRLGFTQQCIDSTKMGVGMPEYLLIFRKPPTDRSNAYADDPVEKQKKEWIPLNRITSDYIINDEIREAGGMWVNTEGYSLSKWQVDAHGFTRSSGDRRLKIEELSELECDKIFKLFRYDSLNQIYDFEHHVKVGDKLELHGKLPTTFMLLQPQSWSPEVWTDITRMRTLNSIQHAKGREMHLCPMQLDLVDRAIIQWSNTGDIVLDPFAGIGTVPSEAVKLERYGMGIELATNYFLDGVTYCKAAENKQTLPSLFDVIEPEVYEENLLNKAI